MSDHLSVLRTLSAELAALATAVVPATAIVTGQTMDFGTASGSAWMFDDQHLVTNRHVVAGLVEPIWVRFPNDGACQAELQGSDPYTDLALLRVSPRATKPLQVRSTGAALGELCFAFGSPLGEYPESMSIGIVSGLNRELRTIGGRSMYDVLQTDAAINPGNSGGPLVDVAGEVIGVNTAGIDGAESIGFALSSATVFDIASELRTYGEIRRASLGVSIASQNDKNVAGAEHITVTALRSNKAGPFEVGDVLVTMAGVDIKSRSDLFQVLRRAVIDADTTVVLERSGTRVAVLCRPTAMDRTIK